MTPSLDRRRFLTLSAAAAAGFAAVPSPTLARAASPGGAPLWGGYDRAIVIDALGGLGSATRKDDAPLEAAELEQARASGVTAINTTVGSVGILEGAFQRRSSRSDSGTGSSRRIRTR